MRRKLRLGMLGCGHIAWRHIACLEKIGDCSVVALADPNRDMLDERARQAGGKPEKFEDPLGLIKEADIDAVYFCVPPFAHGAIEKAAAERNLPIFIEKPVAPSLAEAEEICAVLGRDQIVSVAYNWRYIPNAMKMKNLCLKESPIFFRSEWKEKMPGAAWWRKMKLSGGPLVEQASHLLDLGLYLIGPVKRVLSAAIRNDRPRDDGDIPDSLIAVFEFENGTTGELVHTCMLNQLRHRIGVELIFPKMEARLERDGRLELICEKRRAVHGANSDRLLCNLDSYEAESRVFLDAVRSGDRSRIRCTYHDAMRTLALAEAIYESARTGKPVLPAKVVPHTATSSQRRKG